jgi:hypothetical protein
VQIARGVLLHDETPLGIGGKRTRLGIRSEWLGRPARISLRAIVLQVSQRGLQSSARSRPSVDVPTPSGVWVKNFASLVDFSHGRVRPFRANRSSSPV